MATEAGIVCPVVGECDLICLVFGTRVLLMVAGDLGRVPAWPVLWGTEKRTDKQI